MISTDADCCRREAYRRRGFADSTSAENALDLIWKDLALERLGMERLGIERLGMERLGMK
jgi:hypothetical protein